MRDNVIGLYAHYLVALKRVWDIVSKGEPIPEILPKTLAFTEDTGIDVIYRTDGTVTTAGFWIRDVESGKNCRLSLNGVEFYPNDVAVIVGNTTDDRNAIEVVTVRQEELK